LVSLLLFFISHTPYDSHPCPALVRPTEADKADNIESNITSVAQNTSSASEELTTAHEYQRKAGRRMLCLLIILVVVILVVLLAVSPLLRSPSIADILDSFVDSVG
jgi:CHASE3 domain sensor protein